MNHRKWPRSHRRNESLDEETGWYLPEYFQERLDAEVVLARGKGQSVGLLFFRLPLAQWGITSQLRVFLTIRLGLLIWDVTPCHGFFGRLAEDDFAACIPDAEEAEAIATLQLLQHTLSGLSAETAVAAFPEDAADGSSLLEAARQLLRDDRTNLVYLDEYRHRRHGRAA